MKRVLSLLQRIEDGILVASFVVMVLASFAQVVNRNLVHAGISWFEELARYCMVYMALLAAEAGLRDGTQISVTLLTDRLPAGASRVIALVARAVVVIFAAVCCVSSFAVLETQIASGQISPGLKLPMVVPYFALPLSFGIITLVQTAAFGSDLLGLIRGRGGEVER